MSKYKQRKNGEPITLLYQQAFGQKGARMNFCCCDCGLVHQVAIVPLRTRVKLYFWRENRATANTRRRKGGCKKK